MNVAKAYGLLPALAFPLPSVARITKKNFVKVSSFYPQKKLHKSTRNKATFKIIQILVRVIISGWNLFFFNFYFIFYFESLVSSTFSKINKVYFKNLHVIYHNT